MTKNNMRNKGYVFNNDNDNDDDYFYLIEILHSNRIHYRILYSIYYYISVCNKAPCLAYPQYIDCI